MRHKLIGILFCLILLLEHLVVNGQSRDIRQVTEEELNRDITETEEDREKRRSKVTLKGAMDFYWNGNFKAALEDFLVLLAKEPENVDINFYIGACYLETNIDKLQAIQYLEYVVQQPKFPQEAIYQLARAYMFALRFDEAIITFNKYKDIQRGKDDNIVSGSRMIEKCFNGKQLVKYPRNVKFENLGSLVNSPYPDYNPFIPEDESFIVFSTKRPDCLGLQLDYDGFKTPDIFLSRASKGQYREARNIGSSVNTEWFEEVVGVSAEGNELLVYIDNYDGYDDIFVSPRKGRFFDEYLDIGRNVNTDQIETTASMSADGTILFFSRELDDMKNGTDLYMSRKLPNGTWGVPVKLPEVINTKYNESFPHLSYDGKTFYFSSEGHSSMGGFDIFVSEYDDLTGLFSVPKNLGYPINTVDDDFNISMSATGRYGYTSQFRQGEGFGERDIYRVTFFDVDPVYTIIRGSVTNIKDSLEVNPSYKVGKFEMTVTDMNTDQFIGVYKPNVRNSNYAQVLEPGEYCVYVQGELFFDTSAVIEVLGKDAQVSELIKDYTLRPDPDAIARAKMRSDDGGAIYAMTGSNDGSARLWELPTGKQVLKLQDSDEVTTVAFSHNGKYAMTGANDGHLTLWTIPDGSKYKTLQGHRSFITSAEFTPNGKYLLTSSADSTVRLWNVETGLIEKSYLGHQAKVNDISISSDGNYFVSVSDDGNALMWEIMTENLVGVYDGHKGAVTGVDFASQGNFVVTSGTDGTIDKWNASTAVNSLQFKLHGNTVTSIKLSPDASTAISGSKDGFIYAWSSSDAKVKHALVGLNSSVTGIFISKNGEYVLASDKGNSPKVWKLASGDEITTLLGHTKTVNDVCFTPFIKLQDKEDAPLRRPDPVSSLALEEEIAKLEQELIEIEKQKALGYDPTLLDADVNRVKQLKPGQKIILERIYFDFDKSDIRDESIVELNKLLVFLTSNPRVIVEISGHTDSRGTDDYNMKLSLNRAKSVVSWLKNRDIPAKRVAVKGYGKSRNIAPNENPDGSDNPEGRQMNRRIELTIVSVGGDKILTTEGR
jgi:WD40 repeat protein/outer membrane protein OmpA-like peptidoglycan-associated protein